MNEMRTIARRALMLAGAVACTGALAQAPASAAAPSPDATNAADRAQKQADRTLYWIRVLAEKPAAKPAAVAAPAKAAPTATAAAVAAPPVAHTVAAAAEPRQAERVKVASAPSSVVTTDGGNATGGVVTPVAAAVPSMPIASGAPGNAAAGIASGGVDAGLSAPAVAAGLAAPAMTPPETDVAPPEVEEPDPGLIMTKSADPQFPMAAMRRLRKGEVEVRFEVGADGQVEVVSVVRSTNPGLNTAALDAVRQWQFKPTPKGHTAVVDLAFNLDI